MVRLQHKTRREGGITVGDPPKHYLLDSEGIVEVTEEHARMLSGTGMWKPEGVWPSSVPPAVEGVGRRPRTFDELREAAAAENIELPPKPEEQISAVEPPPVAESPLATETETITITPETSFEELKDVAKQLGIKIPRRITRSELFELIRAQGEK